MKKFKTLEDRITKMKIKGTKDNWICLCGNTALEHGFYPCDSEGYIVEPTPYEWTTNWYVCDKCGRIIDQETLEIKGIQLNSPLSLKERMKLYPNG